MAHLWRKSLRCTLRTPSGCYLRCLKPPHKRMSGDEYQRCWVDRHDVGLCAPYAHPGVWPHHQHWQHIWTPYICRRFVTLLATTISSHSHAHAHIRPNALTPTLVPHSNSYLSSRSLHRQHPHTNSLTRIITHANLFTRTIFITRSHSHIHCHSLTP